VNHMFVRASYRPFVVSLSNHGRTPYFVIHPSPRSPFDCSLEPVLSLTKGERSGRTVNHMFVRASYRPFVVSLSNHGRTPYFVIHPSPRSPFDCSLEPVLSLTKGERSGRTVWSVRG